MKNLLWVLSESLFVGRYRWAFIGGAAAGEVEEELDIPEEEKKKKKSWSQQTSFKPHIIRLARLLNTKVSSTFFHRYS